MPAISGQVGVSITSPPPTAPVLRPSSPACSPRQLTTWFVTCSMTRGCVASCVSPTLGEAVPKAASENATVEACDPSPGPRGGTAVVRVLVWGPLC